MSNPQYTVRNAMLQAVSRTVDSTLTMGQLDTLTLGNYFGIFQVPTARRVAQELVAEGVLTRTKPGVYRVNRGTLNKKLKAL